MQHSLIKYACKIYRNKLLHCPQNEILPQIDSLHDIFTSFRCLKSEWYGIYWGRNGIIPTVIDDGMS